MAQKEYWPQERPVFSREQVPFLTDGSPLSKESRSKVTVSDIIRNSGAFPIEFPVSTVKCDYLRNKGILDVTLERNINSVYPILHETALPLFLQFLTHKKRFGSSIEKKFYKEYTVELLIDRLLSKRAVVFCGRHDMFMLMDGLANASNWEVIGTSKESPPRILEQCLSYDEIKLSALLSVSSYTHFINDGGRDNCGKYSNNREQLEEYGVIIGLIGTRLCKPQVMEYQDIVITKEQNIKEKGYGQCPDPTLQGIFMNFYEQPCLTYENLKDEFKDTKKYHRLSNDRFFNNDIYEKRLSLSFDTLLLEANERGKELNKMAYVFVVGIGLGVWRISSHQNKIFMDAFCKRIRFLGSNLTNVSDICFSYIGASSCGKYKDQDTMPISGHSNEGIKIHFMDRNPHTKLTGNDKDKLLVVSYAWDGNSLPGNEFWLGNLASSSDPAAACSTQIAELHNAHINTRVSAKHLRIATLGGRLKKYYDYIETLNVS